MNEKAIEFAREMGYDGAEYAGEWKGYKVYEPTTKGATEKDPAIIGIPLIILVKGDQMRWSTVDEAFEYMRDSDEIEEV